MSSSDRRRRRVVWPLVLLGVLLLLPAAGLALLRLVPSLQLMPLLGRSRVLALLASFVGYGTLGWLGAAALLLAATVRSRRRVGLALVTGVAVLGLALQLSWITPHLVPDARRADGQGFTVMSLNLYVGRADPQQVVAQAQRADVVVLLEMTPASDLALRAAGLQNRFGYQVGDGEAGVSGSAVYSRYPIRAVTELTTSFQQWVTEVDVPQLGPVTLIATHPCNPFCGSARWAAESEQVRRAAEQHRATPTVIAGDFNAVDDQLPLLLLGRDGFADAAEVAGAGLLPTYPANKLIPPLIGIDHVMINSRLTATAVEAFTVAGTDHRGLLATLAPTGSAG